MFSKTKPRNKIFIYVFALFQTTKLLSKIGNFLPAVKNAQKLFMQHKLFAEVRTNWWQSLMGREELGFRQLFVYLSRFCRCLILKIRGFKIDSLVRIWTLAEGQKNFQALSNFRYKNLTLERTWNCAAATPMS